MAYVVCDIRLILQMPLEPIIRSHEPMCPPGYHHNNLVATVAHLHMMQAKHLNDVCERFLLQKNSLEGYKNFQIKLKDGSKMIGHETLRVTFARSPKRQCKKSKATKIF